MIQEVRHGDSDATHHHKGKPIHQAHKRKSEPVKKAHQEQVEPDQRR